MDLRAMLNEGPSTQKAAQVAHPPPPSPAQSLPHPPPRLHTHHSSYDQSPPYASQPYAEAPPPLSHASSSFGHHPHPSSEYRASANGYFAVQSQSQSQSPHQPQHSASTPSAIYAQSPGPHGQTHTPRDSIPPPLQHQSPFGPSPSPSGQYPPTPGSVHHYPATTPSSATTYQHQLSAHPSINSQSPTQRADYISTNGTAHASQTRLSPQAQFHPPPVTPLGPPVAYPRPSPHTQRPISHGQESVRRSSIGSVGSIHSREHNQLPYDHPRSGSGNIQRTFSGDVRERERSIESVSPKTIPKPPPMRRSSVSRYSESMSDPYAAPQPPSTSHSAANSVSHLQTTPDRVLDNQHYDTTPKSSVTSVDARPPLSQYNTSDPAPPPTQNITPQPAYTSLPPQHTPQVRGAPTMSLKRRASTVSDHAPAAMPPRKRLRHDEIPIWARSARQAPLRIVNTRPPTPPVMDEVVVKKEPISHPATNGQALQHPPTPPQEIKWEASIMGDAPLDELCTCVADWIFINIGQRADPGGGAMFEIEAKVGTIFDEQTGTRLRLPVGSEAKFEKQLFPGRTSFKSSMDVAQHKNLNEFLNGLVLNATKEAHETGQPPRILYKHQHEFDEFYELTKEGERNLPMSIRNFLNPHHKTKVRRTIDETDGTVTAQIIKTRIADLDIYNPRWDFDYRISISVESPWQGDPGWLTEMTEGGRDRKKDRMSYRHLAHQIDLTQVSYTNSPMKEHELEVEISTEQVRIELAKAKAGQDNRYHKLVSGLVDNVRILCQQGTTKRPPR